MRELWAELGATMRMLRTAACLSLRQVEARCGVGRGTLSQVENGKARASRSLVEWYDSTLHGDGLLLTMYAEARGAHGPSDVIRDVIPHVTAGDELTVSDATIAAGQRVLPGSTTVAGWKLHNTGSVTWTGRRLTRVGTPAGVRLIASDPSVPIPDCEPGESCKADVVLSIPSQPGTYAAYWHMVDDRGRPCLPPNSLLAVVVLAAEH